MQNWDLLNHFTKSCFLDNLLISWTTKWRCQILIFMWFIMLRLLTKAKTWGHLQRPGILNSSILSNESPTMPSYFNEDESEDEGWSTDDHSGNSDEPDLQCLSNRSSQGEVQWKHSCYHFDNILHHIYTYRIDLVCKDLTRCRKLNGYVFVFFQCYN